MAALKSNIIRIATGQKVRMGCQMPDKRFCATRFASIKALRTRVSGRKANHLGWRAALCRSQLRLQHSASLRLALNHQTAKLARRLERGAEPLRLALMRPACA